MLINNLLLRISQWLVQSGIKPEDREKIFEEFYRVRSKETSGVPGTGLGLSLVKNLLYMHNGKISVESTPGEGSVFTLSIPLADADSEVPAL